MSFFFFILLKKIDDPLRFKPNPADLMKSGEEEEEDEDKGLYKIPKIAPAKFEEDTSNLSFPFPFSLFSFSFFFCILSVI